MNQSLQSNGSQRSRRKRIKKNISKEESQAA